MATPTKILLRVTPDLHAHLKAQAAERGVSLNSWIILLLAGASGFKYKPSTTKRPPPK